MVTKPVRALEAAEDGVVAARHGRVGHVGHLKCHTLVSLPSLVRGVDERLDNFHAMIPGQKEIYR